VPSIVDSGDGQAVELGVKFTSTTSGYITGLRFYKSSTNTGTHTGTLWSASGQQLATATFTSETSSGWQQVTFSSPVAITAGTTYVASYHTNVGHYSVSRSYFASTYTSGPLQVGVNGGTYLYGTGGFPTNTYQSSNYFVDVVFTTTPPPPGTDTTAPTVTAFSPASGATNVTTTTAATVTFSEALDATTVTSATVFLRDANNNMVSTTLVYNSTAKTVTLTPTAALANSATYTIVVKGGTSGVKDLAGNALVADVTSSFTTAAVVTSPGGSLFGNSVPSIVDSGDARAVELGVKFTPSKNGYISAIRFYKSAGNTGLHTATLWDSTGRKLGSVVFVNETASGWQTAYFSKPIAVRAGRTYTASYYTTVGHYSLTPSYFATAFTSGYLKVPTNGGVYRYGTSGLPTTTSSSNYFVDVIFS
jgi:hypothetical protein